METMMEHKQLAEDLKRAKARRVAAQNAMFAAPRNPRNQREALSTKEFEKATDAERAIGSGLDMLRDEARVRLTNLAKAQAEGKQIDAAEVRRLSDLVNEITADLAAIMANPGPPARGAFWMKGEKQDVR